MVIAIDAHIAIPPQRGVGDLCMSLARIFTNAPDCMANRAIHGVIRKQRAAAKLAVKRYSRMNYKFMREDKQGI